jgi:hypothetical protein
VISREEFRPLSTELVERPVPQLHFVYYELPQALNSRTVDSKATSGLALGDALPHGLYNLDEAQV